MNNNEIEQAAPDGVNEAQIIDKELQDALEMPDSEYIEHLEKYIEALAETNRYGHEAMQTFVDLLAFIGENFGNTLDYPIRIDNDFYEGLFDEKLRSCQEKLTAFLEAHGHSNLLDDDEDEESSEEEVF